MDNNLHELAFILDQSNAIDDILDSATKSFKGLMDSQKKYPLGTNVTAAVFGCDYQWVFNNTPIGKVKISKNPLPTSGVCPLIDSAVRTIDEMGERLAETWEERRPSKIIVTIVTFGRDNASKKFTYEELAERIRIQTDVYKWKFFLLTDFSINMEKLGIPEEDTIIIKKSEKDTFKKAYSELDEKISAVRDRAAGR